MSTEQRDKAAITGWTLREQRAYRRWIFEPDDADPNAEEVEALRQENAWHAGYGSGWDAHAATMPERKAVAALIKEQFRASGWIVPPSICLSSADAVLALVNKEGGE